jgi:hypothetical protein
MRGRLPIGLFVVAVLAVLLVGRWSSVGAQPVAGIKLPAPGATKQLYPGCNNIALTFPNGTASGMVVQAVTPAGAVEAMWRHNASLNMFEGFSPIAPQASDLLNVGFLDAVWLCVRPAVAPGVTPPSATTPSPAATAAPMAATATPTPNGAAPQGSAAPTDALESFRYAYEASVEGEAGFALKAEGEFVAPDRLACTISVSLGDVALPPEELVVIGGDAWLNTGEGFQATSVNDAHVVDDLGVCPGSPVFWEDFPASGPGSLQGQPETVNGVASLHYSPDDLAQAAAFLGGSPAEMEGTTINAFDIWLAVDGGWLVALNLDVSVAAGALGGELDVPTQGADQQVRLKLRLDITDPNGADIHVEPPAG